MMPSNLIKNKTKYLILFLIAIQSILLALGAIFFTSTSYQKAWQDYNQDEHTLTVYLQKLTQEQAQEVFYYFTNQSNLAIWTQRSKSDEKGSGIVKHYIDIMGNPNYFSPFVFNNTTILPQYQIETLLSHKDTSQTIGLDKGEANLLYPLPQLLFSPAIVIDRLENTYQQTGHLAGIYHINGLVDNKTADAFLAELAQITSRSVDDLTRESFGSHRDYGLTPLVLVISLIINVFIILTFFLVFILKDFKLLGMLILLGWSKKAFWIELFKPFLLFSTYLTPVISLLLWFLSGYHFFGLTALLTIFFAASFSTGLLGITLLLPSLVIYMVSPLAAIHQRLPHKLLLGISTGFYLLIGGLLITVSYTLDAPMDTFINHVQLSKKWQAVENMSVLSQITEGDDEGTYAGTTNSLEKSMYRLYRHIEHLDGVYLAHGDYMDENQLKNLAASGVYEHLPSHPFWYLTYSYNYLETLGLSFTEAEHQAIRDGTRLYLIPDTLSSKERQSMEAYLQESVRIDDNDIETAFTQNPRFAYKTYSPSESLLTWSPQIKQNITTKNPIVFVASSDNLYFMESANLSVTGYNGLLKLKDNKTVMAVQQIIQSEFPDLLDNDLRFLTVKQYINGLQKKLSHTIYLFGSLIGLILIMLLAVFWSLVLIYQILFREKLAVKYLFGFSAFHRYAGLFSFIILTYALEIFIAWLIGSKLGIVMATIAIISQYSLLYFSVLKNEHFILIKPLKE